MPIKEDFVLQLCKANYTYVLNGASSGMYFVVSDQNYDGGLKLGQPEEPGGHFPLHC
jgi:hypothetical protein